VHGCLISCGTPCTHAQIHTCSACCSAHIGFHAPPPVPAAGPPGQDQDGSLPPPKVYLSLQPVQADAPSRLSPLTPQVFKEVHRCLKPGGTAIMSFSNRCFPTKAIAIWSQTGDLDHIW
jgi:hypothetical protein